MKVVSINPKDGINAKSHRKENAFMYEFSVIAKTETGYKTPLIVRVYGTNSANYVCLWSCNIKDGVYFSGSARSTGFGFHRPSEAFAIALKSAGIELDTEIAGRGDDAMKDAIQAICEYYGYSDFYIHKSHA